MLEPYQSTMNAAVVAIRSNLGSQSFQEFIFILLVMGLQRGVHLKRKQL
jgi:hypothetical protein